MKSVLPRGFWKGFGPGLMWAAAAIGVSHLVQSTRAGAVAGFGFAGVILIALIFKYPFFEYGPRYAAATGQSLVEGYRRIGAWALWLYFGLAIVTAVIHQVAILLFMSFLIQYMLGVTSPPWVLGGLLYAGCGVLLALGRFRGLDLTIKIILVGLAVSTLIAAGLAFPKADFSTLAVWPDTGGVVVRLGFILALVGFMPSPIEISVMSSLWTLAKDQASHDRASVATALFDFRVGYVGTGFFAFAFLLLGAAVMYGSGQQFSPQGAAFSTQLVDLYTSTLGSWTRSLVLVAVVTTMFSTTLIVIDGWPRVVDRCLQNLNPNSVFPKREAGVTRAYWILLVVFGALNILGLSLFATNLTPMIDFATIFTFIVAPVLGYLNLRAITSEEVAAEHRPGPLLLAISYVGLFLLVGTTVVYVASRFGL